MVVDDIDYIIKRYTVFGVQNKFVLKMLKHSSFRFFFYL